MSVKPDRDGAALRILPTVRPRGLRLDGEIDDRTYPALLLALGSVEADRRREDVHLDLSLVRFCDVAGLRAISGLAERLGGDHGSGGDGIVRPRSSLPTVGG